MIYDRVIERFRRVEWTTGQREVLSLVSERRDGRAKRKVVVVEGGRVGCGQVPIECALGEIGRVGYPSYGMLRTSIL